MISTKVFCLSMLMFIEFVTTERLDNFLELRGPPFYHQIEESGTIILCDVNFTTDQISIERVELDCKELQTPGLSVASSGEQITRDIDFYKKVGDSILHVELNLTFNTANPGDSLQSTATIVST